MDRDAACAAPLQYQEYAPAPWLRHAVACYWQFTGMPLRHVPQMHRVLPDACIEIREVADVFGIRFKPGGAGLLCAGAICDYTDTSAPADLWLGAAASTLMDRLALTPTLAVRANIVDQCFRERAVHGIDPLIAAAMPALDGNDPEGRSIASVAQRLGVSERQLERRFSDAVGLSPVGYRRVRRFRRLLEVRARARHTSWAQAAAEVGYADQSHMAREFQRLAGVSATRWSIEQTSVGFVQEHCMVIR